MRTLKELERRCSLAKDIANNSLYFADSSDYEAALWDVLKTLSPERFDNEGNLIGELDMSGEEKEEQQEEKASVKLNKPERMEMKIYDDENGFVPDDTRKQLEELKRVVEMSIEFRNNKISNIYHQMANLEKRVKELEKKLQNKGGKV